ncbi:MAG: hypothetical protein M1829_000175 [Trizodia sp. TS-e1964]|nr:MAG: hypothetical protein M1829_000175 [Trizodia sp. TS-e1964]
MYLPRLTTALALSSTLSLSNASLHPRTNPSSPDLDLLTLPAAYNTPTPPAPAPNPSSASVLTNLHNALTSAITSASRNPTFAALINPLSSPEDPYHTSPLLILIDEQDSLLALPLTPALLQHPTPTLPLRLYLFSSSATPIETQFLATTAQQYARSVAGDMRFLPYVVLPSVEGLEAQAREAEVRMRIQRDTLTPEKYAAGLKRSIRARLRLVQGCIPAYEQ